MLEGTLVNLRAPEMDDLDRNTRWINDREVTRYLFIRYEMSQMAEEAWLREVCAKPMTFQTPFFAIETKEGHHIGNINLFKGVAEEQKAELGIMIGEKSYWSQGFGTDALRTLLRFGFDEMNLQRVMLLVYAFNERAQAAYRKAGFVEEGRRREALYTEGGYHDIVVMSVLRNERER